MKSIRKSLAEILAVLLIIGMLPVSPGRIAARASTDETATESDALEDGAVTIPDNGTASDAAFDRTVTVSEYTIRVTAASGVFPEGSTLSATLVTDEEQKQKIDENVSKASDGTLKSIITFDVKILDKNGDEIEPDLSSGTPTVTIGNVTAKTADMEEESGTAKDLKMYHLDDDLQDTEVLDSRNDSKAKTVSAEGSHFSLYGVGQPLSQTPTGTFVLSDYYYSVSGDTITLTSYVGSPSALYVPGTYKPADSTTAAKNKPAVSSSTTYTIALKESTAENSNIWSYALNWVTSISFGEGVKLPANCQYMFSGLGKLTSLDLSNFDTSSVTNMNSMFSGCLNLTSLDLSNFNTSNVTDMNYMFSNCKKLATLNLGDNFDTSRVADMTCMFAGCCMTSLDLGKSFFTSNVTNMCGMFSGCSGLATLTFDSNFNTSSVTDMSYLFSGCSSLTGLDLSQFNTASVMNMYAMFYGCSNLTTLTLESNFKTSSVTDMSYMFYDCGGLTGLDLSQFNTSNVENMYSMFYGCSNLTELDLSHFDATNVTYMDFMFAGCSSICTLKTPEAFNASITMPNLPGTVDTNSIENPYTFYKCNDDGTLDNTPYTELPTDFSGSSVTLIRSGYYPVTFNTNGGSDVNSLVILSGNTFTKPTDPTKAGSVFAGWYKEAGLKNTWDFNNDTITAATILYAKWTVTANTYTVSFNANGHGTAPADVSVADGELVTEPAALTETGYTFGGWYKEAVCTNVWNFASDKVSGNTTLYAKWTKQSSKASGSNSESSGSSNSSSSSTGNTSGTWVIENGESGVKWQFKMSDGTFAKNTWVKTGNHWYHFDSNGYAQTGWVLDNGKWYHCDPSTCAMDTGLYHDDTDGQDYYLNPDGSMATGWVTIDGKQYYFNPDQAAATYTYDPVTQTWIWNGADALPYGAMLKNTKTPDGHHVDETGARID